jgi:hypothetical protein
MNKAAIVQRNTRLHPTTDVVGTGERKSIIRCQSLL